MTDKKALLIAATGASPDTVIDLSENRFRIIVQTEVGTVKEEHQVWTDEEAVSFGYFPEKGAIATSDPAYKVYRII